MLLWWLVSDIGCLHCASLSTMYIYTRKQVCSTLTASRSLKQSDCLLFAYTLWVVGFRFDNEHVLVQDSAEVSNGLLIQFNLYGDVCCYCIMLHEMLSLLSAHNTFLALPSPNATLMLRACVTWWWWWWWWCSLARSIQHEYTLIR